jgi:hypothetical protein
VPGKYSFSYKVRNFWKLQLDVHLNKLSWHPRLFNFIHNVAKVVFQQTSSHSSATYLCGILCVINDKRRVDISHYLSYLQRFDHKTKQRSIIIQTRARVHSGCESHGNYDRWLVPVRSWQLEVWRGKFSQLSEHAETKENLNKPILFRTTVSRIWISVLGTVFAFVRISYETYWNRYSGR